MPNPAVPLTRPSGFVPPPPCQYIYAGGGGGGPGAILCAALYAVFAILAVKGCQ